MIWQDRNLVAVVELFELVVRSTATAMYQHDRTYSGPSRNDWISAVTVEQNLLRSILGIFKIGPALLRVLMTIIILLKYYVQ